MKRTWIVGLIVGLLVFSLGCSLTSILQGVEEAQEVLEIVDEAQGEDTSIGAEEDTSVEAAEPVEFDPAALDELDSYRMVVEFRFENADGTTEEQTIEIAHTREPAAEHTIMSEMMGEEQSGDIEIIHIGSQQWMRMGEEWIYSEVQEGEEDFIGDAAGIEGFNEEDLADAKDLGLETVNGIRCRHYELDEESAAFAEGVIDGEVEEAHGEIWVAEESGLPAFMVRYELQATSTATDESPVEKFFVTMNVTDVNTNITIEPPTEAEASGDTGDIPVMENAQNKTVIGGIIVYETASDFQSVVDFYAAEMEAEGWTKSGTVMSIENALMESWTKGARSLQLNIVVNEGNGQVAVTMIVEGEE